MSYNYIIVQTWNGEGYSYQNKIVSTFETDTDKGPSVMNRLVDMIRKIENIREFEEYGNSTDNGFTYEVGNHQGSYQWFQVLSNHVGILIHPEENEVILLTEEQALHQLRLAVIQADEDDLELTLTDYKNIFINAYHEDLSYQFQFFSPIPQSLWKALVLDNNNLIYIRFFQMEYDNLYKHCTKIIGLKDDIVYTQERLAEIATQHERNIIIGKIKPEDYETN